jgi:hypothetical protein
MLLYNTEWWYDHGMAVNYLGKTFLTLGPGDIIERLNISEKLFQSFSCQEFKKERISTSKRFETLM